MLPDMVHRTKEKAERREEKKDISMTIISGKFTYIHLSASSRQTVAMRRVARFTHAFVSRDDHQIMTERKHQHVQLFYTYFSLIIHLFSSMFFSCFLIFWSHSSRFEIEKHSIWKFEEIEDGNDYPKIKS